MPSIYFLEEDVITARNTEEFHLKNNKTCFGENISYLLFILQLLSAVRRQHHCERENVEFGSH